MQCKACGKDNDQRDSTCRYCGASVTDAPPALRLVSGAGADDEGDPDATICDADLTLVRPGPGWQRAVMSAQKTLPGHLFPVPDLPSTPPAAEIPAPLPDAAEAFSRISEPFLNGPGPVPGISEPSLDASGPAPGSAEPFPNTSWHVPGTEEPSPNPAAHSAAPFQTTVVPPRGEPVPWPQRSPEPGHASESAADLAPATEHSRPEEDSPIEFPGSRRRSGLPMLVGVLAIVVAGIALLWWLAALRALDAGSSPPVVARPASAPATGLDGATAAPAAPPVAAASLATETAAAPSAAPPAPQGGISAFSPPQATDAPVAGSAAASAEAPVALAALPAPRPRNTAARQRSDKSASRKAGDEGVGPPGSAASRAEPPKSLDDLLK